MAESRQPQPGGGLLVMGTHGPVYTLPDASHVAACMLCESPAVPSLLQLQYSKVRINIFAHGVHDVDSLTCPLCCVCCLRVCVIVSGADLTSWCLQADSLRGLLYASATVFTHAATNTERVLVAGGAASVAGSDPQPLKTTYELSFNVTSSTWVVQRR